MYFMYNRTWNQLLHTIRGQPISESSPGRPAHPLELRPEDCVVVVVGELVAAVDEEA